MSNIIYHKHIYIVGRWFRALKTAELETTVFEKNFARAAAHRMPHQKGSLDIRFLSLPEELLAANKPDPNRRHRGRISIERGPADTSQQRTSRTLRSVRRTPGTIPTDIRPVPNRTTTSRTESGPNRRRDRTPSSRTERGTQDNSSCRSSGEQPRASIIQQDTTERLLRQDREEPNISTAQGGGGSFQR